ncbi:MAG TPA: tetratricopeptide repeat protein [Pyrinomonadaceae bacterium]
MKLPRRAFAIGMVALLLLNYAAPAIGCGPWPTEPIFVFKESPDLPFTDFTGGKIGIVRPSLGRKTLVIAYRYLNGGSFTGDEQQELLKALKGTAPEEDSIDAVKAWVKTRKELFGEDQKLPQIYTEREDGGSYDFFPNCTPNAFEVATETLKDRAASYGADNANVKLWLEAQDTVFENCAIGSHIPAPVGDDKPTWLRKDRAYQLAAAYFYSLHFDEARTRFEQIAADTDSPWSNLAAYLIGRTLVRQASLTEDQTKKREIYEQAETHLQTLILAGGKFANASRKLFALVKYHLRPEERVVELGQLLAAGSDDNLRQDLIDYVWLVDKLESRILKAEEERKRAAGEKPPENPDWKASRERYEKVERGELITVLSHLTKPDGSIDRYISQDFKPDTPESEVLAAFEEKLGRPLTPDEIKEVKDSYQSALDNRKWKMSPNRKWGMGGMSQFEGCNYECGKLAPSMVPEFFHATDLTDWILTLQIPDPATYVRALAKWRDTDSHAWLVAALTKADASSPKLAELMRAAEKIAPDDPAYPTIAYHLVRLKVATGKLEEARKLLDAILSAPSELLPISAHNLFLEQRMTLAKDLNEFLKATQRKPVAFYGEVGLGTLIELREKEKQWWNPQYSQQSKEENDRTIDESYKDLLPWENRVAFDDKTADIFNWHFPLQRLVDAAPNRDLPDYLQRSLVLAAWTRAILLNKDEVALSIAPEVVRLAPEMSEVLKPYLNSKTPKQRHNAALYVLLKFPNLSPYVQGGLPEFSTSEKIDYYFETAWWCPQEDTELDDDIKEVPKVVFKPGFLTAEELATAHRERVALQGLGDAKSFLGKQVLEWARTSPLDPRLPEALFIAVKANSQYKYGCDGWSFDEKTKNAAEAILRRRYEHSAWTAKLRDTDDQ